MVCLCGTAAHMRRGCAVCCSTCFICMGAVRHWTGVVCHRPPTPPATARSRYSSDPHCGLHTAAFTKRTRPSHRAAGLLRFTLRTRPSHRAGLLRFTRCALHLFRAQRSRLLTSPLTRAPYSHMRLGIPQRLGIPHTSPLLADALGHSSQSRRVLSPEELPCVCACACTCAGDACADAHGLDACADAYALLSSRNVPHPCRWLRACSANLPPASCIVISLCTLPMATCVPPRAPRTCRRPRHARPPVGRSRRRGPRA